MRKNKELFFFFGINSVATFKSKLASDIYPLVTTTTQLLDVAQQPATALNIAFSQSGLTALGVNDLTSSNDPFTSGQAADAQNLGDPTPINKNWVPGFADTKNLHGVILLASDTVAKIDTELAKLKSILGDSIAEVYRLQGEARPNEEEGHEHFGFLDGISQPGIEGFTATPVPGQDKIPAGIILVGGANDTGNHPDWAKDGSFLAFRQLKQLVPEFNKFLTDNPVMVSEVKTAEQGRQLMGARMIGRWKSGAPVDLTPLQDDPALGADPFRNNNFTFFGPGDNSRCPFAAHIRKTYPRSDLSEVVNDRHRIIRAGIPYGPEVTVAEAASNTTTIERGLAFVSYQSNIADGFKFQQMSWANNPKFLAHPNFPVPGFDPIIGANGGKPRNVQGLDLANQTRNITLVTDFIESRGGEYFFSPSLSALRNALAG
ncbi:DyP-type peroxidase [Ramaria rubella]|nr:DyP-type peroxidase [Ramaria rubella]